MEKNKKLIAIIAVVFLIILVSVFAVIKSKKGEIEHTVEMNDELEINVDNKKALIKIETIDTDIKVSEVFNDNVHTYVGIKLSVTNKSNELLNIGAGHCYETLLDSNDNELDVSIIGLEDLNLDMDSGKKESFIKSEIEAEQTEVGYIYFETDSKDIKKLRISFRTKNKTNHKEIELGQELYYADYYINLNMAKANSATNTNSIKNDNSNTNENEGTNSGENINWTNTSSSTNTSNSTSTNSSTNKSFSSDAVSEIQKVGFLEVKLPSNQYTLLKEYDYENLTEKQFIRNDYQVNILIRRKKNSYSSLMSYIKNVYDEISEDEIKETTINSSTWYYISYKDTYSFKCEYFSQKGDNIYNVTVSGGDESTVKQEANKMPNYFKFN